MTSVKETKTEARQGDARRMNGRVLIWGLAGALVALVLLFVFWSQLTAV